MEKYKKIFIVNAVVFVIAGLFLATGGLAFTGAFGVLQAGFNLFIVLILALTGNREKLLQGYLISAGVLFLIGFSLCSTFILRFN